MSCSTAFWWICCNQRVEDDAIDIPMPVRGQRSSKHPSLVGAHDAGAASAASTAAAAAAPPAPAPLPLQQQFSARRLSEGPEGLSPKGDGRPAGGWGRLGFSSDGDAAAAAPAAAAGPPGGDEGQAPHAAPPVQQQEQQQQQQPHDELTEEFGPDVDFSELQSDATAAGQQVPIALASRGANVRISDADSLGLDASMLLPHPPLNHHEKLQQQRLQEQQEEEQLMEAEGGRPEQRDVEADSAGRASEEEGSSSQQQQQQQQEEEAEDILQQPHAPPPPPPPTAPPPRVVFLYASQTGTGREVARTLHAEAAVRGVPADVMSLNELRLPGFGGPETPVVVIVAASTGDGDPPGNAITFIKALHTPQPLGRLAGVRFALLGLGSSAYSRYMNVPRKLRARLLELGATEFYAAGEADAEGPQEAKIDAWCESLWNPLRSALEEATRAQAARTLLAAAGVGSSDNASSTAQQQRRSSAAASGELKIEDDAVRAGEAAAGLSVLGERVSDAGSVEVASAAEGGVPAMKATRVPSLPLPTADITFDVSPEVANFARARELSHPSLEQRSFRDPSGVYSAAAPFWSRIVGARLLTAPGSDRVAILAQLDISGSGMRYSAGDTIGVLPQNDPALVESLLLRLGLDGDAVFEVNPPPGSGGSRSGGALLPHLGAPCTLRHALTHAVEAASVPRKALLRLMAEHCSDDEEKRALLHLCSPEGRDDYARDLFSAHATLVDVLERFPSCQPPIGAVLDALPPLASRLYSVACAGTVPDDPPPSRLEFAFSVAHVSTPAGPRPGVTTGWLARLLAPWLAEGDVPPTPSSQAWVRIFLRPAEAFVPPPSLSTPIIMVGSGTGVAPFRAFLQQRAAAAAAAASPGGASRGEAWLYTGCCRRDEDFLFGEELAEYEKTGLLSRLRVAASREGEKKVYVQHLIRSDAAAVAALIVSAGARVYVCGDGASMGKEVHAALAAALASAVGLSESEAEEELAAMAKKGAYVREFRTPW